MAVANHRPCSPGARLDQVGEQIARSLRGIAPRECAEARDIRHHIANGFERRPGVVVTCDERNTGPNHPHPLHFPKLIIEIVSEKKGEDFTHEFME